MKETVKFSSEERRNLYLALCEDESGDGYLLAADLLREEGYENAAGIVTAIHHWKRDKDFSNLHQACQIVTEQGF